MKGMLTTALMVGAALAAGAAAAYFANTYISEAVHAERSRLQSEYRMVGVVVANADLPPGTLLSGQNAAVREVPQTYLHAEAVRADRWSEIAGRMLTRAVRSGEPVLKSHLAESAAAGFSAQLPQGMRALTFPVDEEASISGMLAPGDRIDILFTTTAGNESTTVPLLIDVPVVATGMRTRANEAMVLDKQTSYSFRTVTVSVTPSDAAKITLAQDAGKITIALRQPQDDAPIRIARITKKALLDPEQSTPVRARRVPVQIILGGI